MKGGEASTVINWWLIVEVEVLGEIKESVDALLLVEDEVRLVRLPDFVPPAAFFWSTKFLVDVVEFDTGWFFTVPLGCPVVLFNPIPGCPGAWVTGDEVLEE